MKNSKLIQVFRTFSKSEFKQFGKFVSSPFFSSGRNVIPLFNAFKKFYPHFEGDGFNRENILEELSQSGRKVSCQHLKTQMSEMYRLAERFLVLQNSINEVGLNTFYFAKNCRNRGLYRLGESKISSSIETIEKKGIDGNFYENYYFGIAERINLYFMRDKPLKGVMTLNHLSEILLHNFLCNSSRYIHNMSVFETGLNINSGESLLFGFFNMINCEELLMQLEGKNDIYSNASTVYLLYMLMFLKPAEETYYFRFKEKLFKNISIFSPYDRSGLLQTLSFVAEKHMHGISYEKFANEIFEIINYRLDNNLYKQAPESFYTANEFHTAFYIGFIRGEKTWLRSFIDKYLCEVAPEQREASALTSQAFLYFLGCEYVKCLQCINHIKSLTVPTAFDIKRLQLMALYEAGHIVEAFYAISAFTGFLKKNKNVSGMDMNRNLNFIKFYTALLKHKYKEEESNLKKMQIEAKNSETASVEWLFEKIEEL